VFYTHNSSPFDDVPQSFKETCTFESSTNDMTKLTAAVFKMAERLYRFGVIGVGALSYGLVFDPTSD